MLTFCGQYCWFFINNRSSWKERAKVTENQLPEDPTYTDPPATAGSTGERSATTFRGAAAPRTIQLQAGIKAEETIQLPPRDTKKRKKLQEQAEEDIRRGRGLRERHGKGIRRG
jgi:hypothetical protein